MLRLAALVLLLFFPVVAEAMTLPSNRINVRNYRAKGDCVADDTAAIQNAINVAVLLGNGTVYLPTGCYRITSGFSLITKPIAIAGDGALQSRIKVDIRVSGYVFRFSETWMAGSFNPDANTVSDNQKSGVYLSNFSIVGNRSSSNAQGGVAFLDRNDHWLLEGVHFYYLKGTALSIGEAFNVPNGYTRESGAKDVKVRSCGDGESSPAILITSTGTGDATNMLYFDNLQVIFPMGRGVQISGENPNKRTGSVHFNKLFLHGIQSPTPAINGDLLYIDDLVGGVFINELHAPSSYANYHAVHITGANSTDAPYIINITANIAPGDGGGIFVERGRNIVTHFHGCATTGACLKMGSQAGLVYYKSEEGQLSLDIDTNAEKNLISSYPPFKYTVSAAGTLQLSADAINLSNATGGAFAVALPAPTANHLGKQYNISMVAGDATNKVTIALTNVVGGSAANTATFDAVGDTLILRAIQTGVSTYKWLVVKEFGVLLT